MGFLYCQNTDCGEYLGSLGADSCRLCGWQNETDETRDPEEGDASPALSQEYIYCRNSSCGAYLGSLGGSSCQLCGWRAGVRRS